MTVLLSGPLGDLPSATAARKLVQGDSAAILPVLGTTAARAVLIGAGMWMAGARDNVARNALAGAVAVEVFVLAWITAEEKGWIGT